MKSILITGASKGLGRELLKLLAEKDYKIFSLSRSDPELNLPNHNFIRADLSNSASLINQLERTKIDLVNSSEILFINNASEIKPIVKAGRFSPDQISKNIEINFTSPLTITNFLLSLEKKVNILNISSGAANKPITGWSLYCSTKAASKMFFEVVQLEHPENKILQIDPGVIDTGMQEDIRNSNKSEFSRLDDFIKLKSENKLKSAREVALNLYDQLLEGQLL